jgi:hypothetical protein
MQHYMKLTDFQRPEAIENRLLSAVIGYFLRYLAADNILLKIRLFSTVSVKNTIVFQNLSYFLWFFVAAKI